MPTSTPLASILSLLDTLTREAEAAEQAASAAEAATPCPSTDTEAGRLRGYAQGLRRALEMVEGMEI